MTLEEFIESLDKDEFSVCHGIVRSTDSVYLIEQNDGFSLKELDMPVRRFYTNEKEYNLHWGL